ncbi:MAG: UDP-N-acetylmuramyl-tripeptide synthetase [Parcubacteria group bacterium]|nr:UDP-N-acetylmuramyl-tripeptide synthetase [Parcubacteria group bacterium]
MAGVKSSVREAVPSPLLSVYHFLWAWFASLVFFMPSRRITLIGVTGTKGKTSTTELLNAIFEEAGYTTAVLNSLRIKTGEKTKPNTLRMSMPGRFGIQRFLARAIDHDCTVAIIEMTSEGAAQFRHRFLHMDCLVFTNLAPEHIDSHGSLEAYIAAKLSLGEQLARSKKPRRVIVANADDALGGRFLALDADERIPFSLKQVEPYHADHTGGSFHLGDTDMRITLPGLFSLYNALAAAITARTFDIQEPVIARGLARVTEIRGRAQSITEGQPFSVIVDYAHTPDSLTALYDAYKGKRLICVLGGTGGGRDLWKRPVMGAIADERCAEVILTTEDPYDEDPRSIADMIARDMKKPPTIILDRRLAIREALSRALGNDAVLITGKGSEPSIHGAGGRNTAWSDEVVVREELKALMSARKV